MDEFACEGGEESDESLHEEKPLKQPVKLNHMKEQGPQYLNSERIISLEEVEVQITNKDRRQTMTVNDKIPHKNDQNYPGQIYFVDDLRDIPKCQLEEPEIESDDSMYSSDSLSKRD